MLSFVFLLFCNLTWIFNIFLNTVIVSGWSTKGVKQATMEIPPPGEAESKEMEEEASENVNPQTVSV